VRAARLSRQHFEVYRLLVAVAFPGREHDGRPVCSWGQDKLAARLGVSTRTLQRLLADLREPGADPRHPHVKPVGLRLGWVTVLPRERPGARHGGRLYGADRYVCNLTAAELVELEALAGFASSDRSDTPAGAVEDHSRSSDRSDTSNTAAQTEATPHRPRSDRSDTSPSNAHRSDTSDRLVPAGQTGGTPGEVSLTHSVPLGRRERGGRGDERPSPTPSQAPATASGGQVEPPTAEGEPTPTAQPAAGTPAPAPKPALNDRGVGLPAHLRAALHEAVGGRLPPRDPTTTAGEGGPVAPAATGPGQEQPASNGGGLPEGIKRAWRDALDTDKRRLAQELADAAAAGVTAPRLEASA
jgi:hypothetical protein